MIAYSYLIPEIIVISTSCFVLVLDLFLKKGYRQISYYLIQISLIITTLTIINNYNYFIELSSPSYSTKIFPTVFKIILLIGMVIIFHYSYNFLKYFC